jgi:hypothetical protein
MSRNRNPIGVKHHTLSAAANRLARLVLMVDARHGHFAIDPNEKDYLICDLEFAPRNLMV